MGTVGPNVVSTVAEVIVELPVLGARSHVGIRVGALQDTGPGWRRQLDSDLGWLAME